VGLTPSGAVAGGEVGAGAVVSAVAAGVLVGGTDVGVAAELQATAIRNNTAQNGSDRTLSFLPCLIVTTTSSFYRPIGVYLA
jgi:hypothetical protein